MRPGVVCAALLALVFPTAASAHTDAGWQVSLRRPADGTITSPFGRDGYRWHAGLDIGILRSLEVRAAADGVVVSTGLVQGYDGYGNVVVIRHRYGYSTIYAHLSRALAHPGQLVQQGELVGEAGCTGWCTGTHLHFELRHDDVPVDPTLLILG